MVRLLIKIAIFLGSAALGLWITSLLVRDFTLHLAGFLVALVVFAIVQLVVDWIVRRFLRQNGPAVTAVAGVVAAFAALLIASLFPDGIVITTIVGWVFATLIVWIVTGVITWLAERFLLPKAGPEGRRR